MAAPVKRESNRRAQKALATRRRVLDAARQLFIADGYGVTTINAIAAAADVAVQTVYAVFRNKRTILQELLAMAATGDDEPVALTERADWRDMERERDPRRQLELLAAIATRIASRVAPLYDVMRAAAGTDADIAETFRRQQQARHDDQSRVARALARRKALRPGLTTAKATDLMWSIASPPMYANLVVERGWSESEYEEWLARALITSLLDDGSPR